jgi:hypothetical protein
MDVFTVVTEKKARKIIEKGGNVVFIHTRENCPHCDSFLPDVLKPIFAKEKYKGIEIYQITESMIFPVGQHPQSYFFKDGRCFQHPAGQTTTENVETLLNTLYLGESPPQQQGPPPVSPNNGTSHGPRNPPVFEINTDPQKRYTR